jgi:glutathione synthase
MPSLQIAFLADPVEQFQVHHDTTFALMLECQRRGHTLYAFEQKGLRFSEGAVRAAAREIEVQRGEGAHFRVVSTATIPLAALDAVLLRKDPPVDVEFLHSTQLVEASAEGPFFMNAPSGLRDANEKLFALRFPGLIPETLVTRDRDDLRRFIGQQESGVILKPIDGFAGRGVLRVTSTSENLGSLLDLVTQHGERFIIAQEYLPASRNGDKRILLLEGEPIGAVLRVPRGNDVRCNLAAGGTAQRAVLTDRDRYICRTLAPHLCAHGLWLVGIDVIGDQLIEVNVTSPTGLVEINALESTRLEGLIIDVLEAGIRRPSRAML